MKKVKANMSPTDSPQSPDAETETLHAGETVSANSAEAVDYGGGIVVRAENTTNLPRPYESVPVEG